MRSPAIDVRETRLNGIRHAVVTRGSHPDIYVALEYPPTVDDTAYPIAIDGAALTIAEATAYIAQLATAVALATEAGRQDTK